MCGCMDRFSPLLFFVFTLLNCCAKSNTSSQIGTIISKRLVGWDGEIELLVIYRTFSRTSLKWGEKDNTKHLQGELQVTNMSTELQQRTRVAWFHFKPW